MRRSPQKNRLIWLCASRKWRAVLLAMAALPVFQATGCYPDIVGSLNFELQSVVNRTLITAVDTIVQNVLGL